MRRKDLPGMILFVCVGLLIFSLIVSTLFVSVQLYKWSYPIDRDVWAQLDRAQVSAEADDMLVYVDVAISGLEERDQISGHCALYFKTLNNDLGAQYQSMKNIRSRLERTVLFDKSSVEYQSAIDDIRGTIRELPYNDCWIWHFK